MITSELCRCMVHIVHSLALLVQTVEQMPAFRWAYLWLAIGGLVLLLAILAYVYLLARRHQEWPKRLLAHPLVVWLDGFLSERMPSLWAFIRRRFTTSEWRGLYLTAAAFFVFVAVYIFALITENSVEEEALYAFDQRIYQWLLEAMHPKLTSSMQLITHLGDGLTVAAIGAVVGAWLLARGDRWQVVSLVLSVGAGAGVMQGLKWIFARTRPHEQLITASGHSFPSGHSFLAATLYGFLIYLVWRRIESDAARIVATIVLTLIITFVGLSRVMLRVHWVSDVAGGLTIGLGWLVCSLLITRALEAYTTD